MSGEAVDQLAMPPIPAPRHTAPDVSADLIVPTGLIVLASSVGALAFAALVAAGYLAMAGAL